MTTKGDRLRSYLLARTGGATGWQAKLVADSGVKRQTITKYTRTTFDGYPDLGTLAQLARALNVATFELVAAMDGDSAVNVLDPRVEEAMARLVDRLLDERLAPRQGSAPRSGAA